MTNPKWVVRFMLNTLLCDTRPKHGESMRLLSEEDFNTEEEALKHYYEKRAVNKYGGAPTHVVCYPVFVADYVPAKIPSKWCDECGEPIHLAEEGEEGTKDEGYTDLPNGDFCSKACFRNAFQGRSEDDNYDEERYYED